MIWIGALANMVCSKDDVSREEKLWRQIVGAEPKAMSSSLESFAPVAQRYRRHAKIAMSGVAVFMTAAAAGLLVSKGFMPVLAIAGLIGWLIAFTAVVTSPALQCTECAGQITRATGSHCPVCGSQPLSKGSWLHVRACSGCGQAMRYGKGGRRFKICYCTHCGAHLDRTGL